MGKSIDRSDFYCPALVPEGALGVRVKKSFTSKKDAQAACSDKRPYLCQYCNQWHLTSNKTVKKRKRKGRRGP